MNTCFYSNKSFGSLGSSDAQFILKSIIFEMELCRRDKRGETLASVGMPVHIIIIIIIIS